MFIGGIIVQKNSCRRSPFVFSISLADVPLVADIVIVVTFRIDGAGRRPVESSRGAVCQAGDGLLDLFSTVVERNVSKLLASICCERTRLRRDRLQREP